MPKKQPNLRLKKERELHNWPQKYVADTVGSTIINVSRWECGITSPSPYFRQKLCELFGKDSIALGFFPDEDDDIDTPLPLAQDEQSMYDPTIPLPFIGSNELVGRDQLVEQLKKQLSTGENVTLIALHGLPGVGKTALAITLASDPDIREQFLDGILWAGLGTQPNVSGILSRWGTLFGVAASGMGALKSNDTWARTLKDVIGTRRMLIVMDDVWEINDATALTVGGSRCTYLITTRFPSIAASFAMQGATLVPELSENDGVTLLQRLAPEITPSDAEKVRALVHSVGALPLALTLAGRYLHVQGYRGQPRRLRAAMERLLEREHRFHLSEAGYTLRGLP